MGALPVLHSKPHPTQASGGVPPRGGLVAIGAKAAVLRAVVVAQGDVVEGIGGLGVHLVQLRRSEGDSE